MVQSLASEALKINWINSWVTWLDWATLCEVRRVTSWRLFQTELSYDPISSSFFSVTTTTWWRSPFIASKCLETQGITFLYSTKPYGFETTAAGRILDRPFPLLKFPSVLFHLLQFYMTPINQSISTSSCFTAFQNHYYLYNEEMSKFTVMCYCLLSPTFLAVDH